MDRARAAGYIDNNFVQNQQRLKKRQDHLDRLKKIMTRKPGSSITLDNVAPVVQQATADDPRKKAKRGLFSVIIERENKVLLQRISAILTEPARDTVKEYDAMKKLIVPKNQGKARIYDQYMEKQRNDKFFASLKNQKPVYRVKEWEDSYKLQKHNQRFMREVKYQRPKGFVDPFAAPPETESTSASKRSRGLKHDADAASPGKDSVASSSAHVHRVRNMRSSGQSHKSATGLRGGRGVRTSRPGGNESSDAGSRDRSVGAHSRSHSRQQMEGSGEGGEHYDEDYDQYYDDGYEEEEEEEFKELLAEARRDIRISEEVAPHGKNAHGRGGNHHHSHSAASSASSAAEVKLAVTAAMADIRCWLVNGEVIVISAAVHEEDRDLEAEAEISVEDLAVLRGEDPFVLGAAAGRSVDDGGGEFPHQLEGGSVYSLAFDLPTLQQIAAEMVSHVELRVDLDSGARLILNLVSEEDPPSAAVSSEGGATVGAASAPSFAPVSAGAAAGALPGASNVGGAQPHDVESLVSEEELGNMLIDDNKLVILTTGAKIPVHFESQVISSSVANLGSLIDAAKIKSRLDFVYALVRVVNTEDDQLAVTVNVMNNTVTQFKRFARAAVVKGSILKIGTSLPSVIHADPELVYTFAQNLVSNIKIVHSNRTGKNILSIENV